jgi:hypothetical protein
VLEPRHLTPFEEYKHFSDSTQKLTERRLAATQTFMAVNTIVFGVLSFAIGGRIESGWLRLAVSLPLFCVGALACVLWQQTIARYRTLIGWRFEELMRLEQGPGMEGSHRFYTKEWEHFYRRDEQRERFGFSDVELWLPRMFLAVYVVYVTGLILATIFGWW